ncbi:MAG TPA: DUF1475 family protein [Steroidobacteraceae bacterium]|nr:DUF1475 family protein [Steroidobacteraceae bacterium]
MIARTGLKLLFSAILIGMLAVTGWASIMQPVWQWGGLVTPPDRGWTIATLCDAYAGFVTFYTWVFYKERGLGRGTWFVAIMLLGNIAMAGFMLRELARLKRDEPLARLLLRR